MSMIKIKADKLNYECAEAYRTIRTNLQFCGEDKKTVVITSCTPDEGKSTVTLYLAMSLAEAGKRVLLVDCDMRRSEMPIHFSIKEKTKGLSHYLSGLAELDAVICNTNMEKMDVILTGPFPPNPAELLVNEKFKTLIQTCREAYDYVLVDSAPLGTVIDSAIIAKECDGSVIVVEAAAISWKFVEEVKEQLEKSGCPILGVILNKIDNRRQSYFNYYYGKKYSKYGKYYGKRYGYKRYGGYGDSGGAVQK